MQELTKCYPKNCLLTVMDRYAAVARDMEQLVLMPSLLQDPAEPPDLYHCYQMLKAIRVDVDHGLLPREEWRAKVAEGAASRTEQGAAGEDDRRPEPLDLEAQFHLHFSSLHHVLTSLTLKAEEVMRRYQELSGQAAWASDLGR